VSGHVTIDFAGALAVFLGDGRPETTQPVMDGLTDVERAYDAQLPATADILAAVAAADVFERELFSRIARLAPVLAAGDPT
jgi:hypothetical protein